MGDSINNLLHYVTSWLQLLKDQLQLIFVEAKLAQSSILPFLATGFILLLLGLSTWLSILTLIGYLFYFLTSQILYALRAVLGANIIFTLIIGFFCYRYYNDVSFQRSRKNWDKISQLKLLLEEKNEKKSTTEKN